MIKAIFLDMDETLCATSQADKVAIAKSIQWLHDKYNSLDSSLFGERYLQGFYKKLNHEFKDLTTLLPDEKRFRTSLILRLLQEQDISSNVDIAEEFLHKFNEERMKAFTFFPDVEEMLIKLREEYKLVVITNGPIFSQYPKLDAVQMKNYVDHIIVGGEEPEEKPAQSIFHKALELVDCTASESIHVGDSLTADIAGANQVGIISVWVNPLQEKYSLMIKPNYTVNSVTELPDLLSII